MKRKATEILESFALVFLITIISFMFSSCSVKKKTNVKKDVVEASDVNYSQEKKESIIKFSESSIVEDSYTKEDEETIYYSPPDSAGRQYITVVSKRRKSNSTIIESDYKKEEEGKIEEESKEQKHSTASLHQERKEDIETKHEFVSTMFKILFSISIIALIAFCVYSARKYIYK